MQSTAHSRRERVYLLSLVFLLFCTSAGSSISCNLPSTFQYVSSLDSAQIMQTACHCSERERPSGYIYFPTTCYHPTLTGKLQIKKMHLYIYVDMPLLFFGNSYSILSSLLSSLYVLSIYSLGIFFTRIQQQKYANITLRDKIWIGRQAEVEPARWLVFLYPMLLDAETLHKERRVSFRVESKARCTPLTSSPKRVAASSIAQPSPALALSL